MMLANEVADELAITSAIVPAKRVIVNRDTTNPQTNSGRSVRNLCVNGG